VRTGESLLQACQAGDQEAWARLFLERSGQVYRWAVFLGLSRVEAEDAAQEVLATAARRIHTCRAEEAMTSWLFQITRRVVANVRRLGFVKRIVLAEDALSPAFEHAGGDDAELELAIRRCLRKLTALHVEVLVLAEVEGHTREEVAALLGIPAGTVASRLRLAREAFRKQWDGPELESDPMLAWGER
jgi:RNA polymerase sigma-70 factor, ECF subfamily